jgi:hypothetical protein
MDRTAWERPRPHNTPPPLSPPGTARVLPAGWLEARPVSTAREGHGVRLPQRSPEEEGAPTGPGAGRAGEPPLQTGSPRPLESRAACPLPYSKHIECCVRVRVEFIYLFDCCGFDCQFGSARTRRPPGFLAPFFLGNCYRHFSSTLLQQCTHHFREKSNAPIKLN